MRCQQRWRAEPTPTKAARRRQRNAHKVAGFGPEGPPNRPKATRLKGPAAALRSTQLDFGWGRTRSPSLGGNLQKGSPRVSVQAARPRRGAKARYSPLLPIRCYILQLSINSRSIGDINKFSTALIIISPQYMHCGATRASSSVFMCCLCFTRIMFSCTAELRGLRLSSVIA